jgi:Tfp pilus assembly protein PilV
MKLTTPRLLILLVVLIGAFAIVKMTRNTSRSSSYRTELVNIEVDRADKIEIKSPEGSTLLTKQGDQWKVETDQGTKDAMEGNVSSMLNTLNTIKPSRLAARSKSKWKDFSVDSAGTQVIVYNEGKPMTDIVLGRFGVEGQRSFYTYVRLSEDEDVYVAADFMKMSVSSRPDDFRNNTLARIKKDSLMEISFNYPDSALVLSKMDGKWMKGNIPADSAAVAGYINGLSIVSSKTFTDGPSALNPDLNVTFGFGSEKEIQISAYQSAEDTWILTSSENDEETWSDQAAFDKVFVASSKF